MIVLPGNHPGVIILLLSVGLTGFVVAASAAHGPCHHDPLVGGAPIDTCSSPAYFGHEKNAG